MVEDNKFEKLVVSSFVDGLLLGANGLIRTIGAPLGDYFWGNIFRILLEKKYFKIYFRIFYLKLYYFVKVCVKNLLGICHSQKSSSPFTSFFIV
jgi:hypothetical protein